MGKDNKGKELGTHFYQRKDGRYEARATINGVKISIYGRNLRELRKQFEEQKELAENRIEARRKRITLNEWFEEWFVTYKIPNIKETSVFPMRRKYYNTFGKYLGHMRVIDITNMDVQNVINRLKSEGKATSTMRDALGRMRDCMEAAKNNMLIPINPCFEIRVPWENKQVKRRFLSQEEQNIFLKAVENNWYKEMFYIMFLTGIRVGEVGGLMWSDVDFDNKCIFINRTLSCQYEYGNKMLRLMEPKTHNSYRRIPFFGEAEEMFRAQYNKVQNLKKALGSRWRAGEGYEDLVFVTTMGSPVLRYHAEKEIKKVVKEINYQEEINSKFEGREPVFFENMYPHAIRHTFCSRCFEAHMQPKVVQKIMGHQHYSTTIDIYTHVTDNIMEEEICKFGYAMQDGGDDGGMRM
ncbi:MAG: tyrosine-type recombinase/integrase [Lachnospiraceae bacterium]|nr:tyrosine-type recombinase/integrase [Lachnospiraceae bacterium]